jgi:hypothetical protein
MKRFIIPLLLLAIVSLLVYIAFFKNSSSQTVSTSVNETQVAWVGPGLYYGMWFDSQDDYNNWYNDNYRNQARRPDQTPDMDRNRDFDGSDRFQGGARSGGGRGR